MAAHWVFGYGSLISARSRARSGASGQYVSVLAKGLSRSWSARVDLEGSGLCVNDSIKGTTAVSVRVVEDLGVVCNGVAVEVNEAELRKLDARESGYQRVRLPTEHLAPFGDPSLPSPLPPGEKVWVYVSDTDDPATPDFPLIQSYIDVILLGAAEISARFVERFVATTAGWGGADGDGDGSGGCWLDDRAKPGYVRADEKALERASEFDGLLRRLVPDAFRRRRALRDNATPASAPAPAPAPASVSMPAALPALPTAAGTQPCAPNAATEQDESRPRGDINQEGTACVGDDDSAANAKGEDADADLGGSLVITLTTAKRGAGAKILGSEELGDNEAGAESARASIPLAVFKKELTLVTISQEHIHCVDVKQWVSTVA